LKSAISLKTGLLQVLRPVSESRLMKNFYNFLFQIVKTYRDNLS